VVTGTSGAGISANAVIAIVAMARAIRAKGSGSRGNNSISIKPYAMGRTFNLTFRLNFQRLKHFH
jgi:hypothetical protein